MLKTQHLRCMIAILAIGLVTASISRAQSTAPTFDVASLKPVQPTPPFPVDLGNTLNGKVTLTNVTLSECLRFAFKINTDAQIAGPDWIKSKNALFQIVAKAPADTSKDQLRLMTLALLTERFKLALHHEQRDLSYLALVVDKKGLKLHAAKEGVDTSASTVRAGRIVVPSLQMGALAVLLGRVTQDPVVDMTELKGSFDVNLEWTPENAPASKSADAAQTGDISVYAAVQEQLGLKLEARKGPRDMVVVDHAERVPVSN